MVVMYCCLGRNNDKVLQFHSNNSSNKLSGALIRGNAVSCLNSKNNNNNSFHESWRDIIMTAVG